MQIYVDADAFPNVVKTVLIRAVERLQIPLTLVANQYVAVPESDLIESLVVENGPDAADDWIANAARSGDLIVTADIPLAARVVGKGAFALNPRGELYTAENVSEHLATRDLIEELRDSGSISGGSPAFSPRDVKAFADQLDRFLTKHCRY